MTNNLLKDTSAANETALDMMCIAPPPPPDSKQKPEQNNASETRLDDAMDKFEDAVKKLPHIYMSRSYGIVGCIKTVFRVDILKRRFKNGGIKMLRGSLLTRTAIDYIDAATRLSNLLVPETALAKGMRVLRNVALLDDLAGTLVEKIQKSGSLNTKAELTSLFGSNSPVNLAEYPVIDSDVTLVSIAVVFVYMMGQLEPGKSIVVNLRKAVVCPDECVVSPGYHEYMPVHFVFKYKNVPVTKVGKDYVYNSATEKSPYVIFDVPELQQTVVVWAQASERAFGERVVCLGGGKACALHWSLDEAQNPSVEWYLDKLSMAVIDHRRFGISIFDGWMQLFERVYDEPAGLFFDGKTGELIKRIVKASQSGISRAYALVGVPGTGKTHIMEKVMREMQDAFVIDLQSANYGPDQEIMLQCIIAGCQQKRIFVMVDDFDKMMAERHTENTSVVATTGNSNTPAQSYSGSKGIIKLFRLLHDYAPGGVAPDGTLLKTFTLVATMNNPNLLNNAIIKRSGRFDEVIDIGIPEACIYGRKLDNIRRDGDRTNFRSWKFRPLYAYMHMKRITLADTANLYDILCINRSKEGKVKFGVGDVFYAAKYLLKNRSNAEKDYAL